MKKVYFLKHSPIQNVVFTKNSSDFVVSEVPMYDFSGVGEHLVLHVRKKELTTWDMLKALSEVSGAKVRDFGYAGLKDKEGMTTQYVSIHKKYEESFKNFSHEKIKILSQTYHNNKIKIGHLKGNRFFIRLKKVLPLDAKKLTNALLTLDEKGYPNYFGYQRFGREKNNAKDGLAILEGTYKTKNKRMKNFLISAYQSELFNAWLSKRVEIATLIESFSVNELKNIFSWDEKSIQEAKNQSQFLKILKGDVLHHYPYGKAFLCENLEDEAKRFQAREITLLGWLIGKRAMQSQGLAKNIEEEFFKAALPYVDKMTGSHRFAWSFLEGVEYNYKEKEAWFEMSFTLQKGSYATVILEELIKQNF